MTLPWRRVLLRHHPLWTASSRSSRASALYSSPRYRHLLTSSIKNDVSIIQKWTTTPVGTESSSSSSSVILGCGAIVSVVVIVAASSVVSTDLEKRGTVKEDENRSRLISYQFPVDFMDKLASKPYLHFADYKINDIDDSDDIDLNHSSSTRPLAVPGNLRLLAVDLPEVRHGFSGGQCRVAADRVYPDGIAPPVLLQLHSPPPPPPPRRRGGHEQDDEIDSNDIDNGEAKGAKKIKNNQSKRNKDKKKKNRHGHDSDAASTTVSVEQKAWVKSMFRCVHGSNSNPSKVGVRVMEAHTAALNRFNLRKTPHPLLMGRTISQQQQEDEKMVAIDDAATGHQDEHNGKSEQSIKSRFTWRSGNPRSDEQIDSKQNDKKQKKTSDKSSSSEQQLQEQQRQDLLVTEEAEAPWNQHAWREELELRISGQVAFGETMQEASGWWNRHVLGRIYQPTIPLYSRSNSVSDWIFFWRRRNSRRGPTTTATNTREEGEDEDEGEFVAGDLTQSNWAYNHKPHAVIANGSALQRVPHSLRLLQKACREHNVPLYVIRDPRKWGASSTTSRVQNNNSNISNTNTRNDEDDDYDDDELGAVLRDLRRTLKKRIISTSLRQQQLTGSRTAFQRGRWWGRLETNMYWESRESIRKSREAVEHVVQNAKALAAMQKREDWSNDDKESLEEKLVRHGVVRKEHVKVVMENNDDDDHDNRKEETGKRRPTKTVQRRIYSQAFSALAQQWVADQHADEKPAAVAQDDDMPENKKSEHLSGKDQTPPTFDKSAL